MTGTYISGLRIESCRECFLNNDCEKLKRRLAGAEDEADIQIVLDTKPKVCNVISIAGGKKMYYARKVSDGGIVTFEGKQLATSEPSLFDHLFGVYNRVVKGQQFDPKDFEIVEVVMLVCERE